jgi:hypothetical protein
LFLTLPRFDTVLRPQGDHKFLKITQFIKILLFVSLVKHKIRTYLIFIWNMINVSDAVRLKENIIRKYFLLFIESLNFILLLYYINNYNGN